MKISLFVVLIFGCFLVYSQANKSIEGRWTMDQVIQNDTDVTAEHNPKSDRFITFFSDGTFESGGAPFGKNTGKYVYDPAKKELKLDSDAGEEDDSRWKVDFEDGMRWQGVGSEWAEKFRITYKKSK